MRYQILRSRRKTISLQMKPEGLIVRAPLEADDQQIARAVERHRDWIAKQEARLAEASAQLAAQGPLSPEELSALTEAARRTIPARVAHFAPLVGVSWGRVTIRRQRSRWGSCSAAGNLNFNCLLMLAPPEVLDSVVVHELCHRLEPNHSRRFYDQVLRVFPDYWRCHDWLRQYGPALMLRLGA